MSKPQRYPTFHDLVKTYIERKEDLTLKEIHNMMQNKYYWDISYPAIVNYYEGKREPHPKFVLLLKYCLRLTIKQFRALIDAIHVDYTHNLYQAFKTAEENLISGGAISEEDRLPWDDLTH